MKRVQRGFALKRGYLKMETKKCSTKKDHLEKVTKSEDPKICGYLKKGDFWKKGRKMVLEGWSPKNVYFKERMQKNRREYKCRIKKRPENMKLK